MLRFILSAVSVVIVGGCNNTFPSESKIRPVTRLFVLNGPFVLNRPFVYYKSEKNCWIFASISHKKTKSSFFVP